MKPLFSIFFAFLLAIIVLTSCEKDTDEKKSDENPFFGEVEYNGFMMDSNRYETPNAFFEIWGENLDSLSADYDIKFTDGIYDDFTRSVKNYQLLVYFDINSPTLEHLSEGVYYIENTDERKPNNIVEAYIFLEKDNKTYKYLITSGQVEVRIKEGFVLVNYMLTSFDNSKDISIEGKYTGKILLIDQRYKEK